MILAVSPFDVLYDLFASDITEINVDIRHSNPFRVQEPLKEERVFQRINVGNSQNIGDNAPCCRSPPRSHGNRLLARVIDKIPDN